MFTVHILCFTVNAQPIVWADSCQSGTFSGKIQTASPDGFSDFSKILKCSNGDLVVLGRIRTHAGNAITGTKGLVLRISATGIVVWSRFISYQNLQQYFDMSIYEGIVTSGGDIVVTTDDKLLKLDGNGQEIWQANITHLPLFRSVQQLIETSDGGILAAGVASQTTFLTKFDALGNTLWSKSYRQTGGSALSGITEVNGAFYFIAKGDESNSGVFESYNILAKLNSIDGIVIWAKKLGRTTSANFTEYVYDKIQLQDTSLVLSGFTNHDYKGPNPTSQSIVSLNLAGNILESKRIFQNDFVTDRSLLFNKKRYLPLYKIGVQYSFSNNQGFCIYKRGVQNDIEWSVKYPSTSRKFIRDIEITADSSVAIVGLNEKFSPNDNYAFLLKTSLNGNLSGCPGTSIQVLVSDNNISVEDLTVNTAAFSPNNQTFRTLSNNPGTDFNFVLSCTGETSGKLGKISGLQSICTGSSGIYLTRRGGYNIQPVQYTCSPSSAGISILSDSSISVNFSLPGRYVLYASMVSACKLLKDSMVINVVSSPGALNLGPDVSLCTNNTVLLKARSGYSTYRWQDGSTDSTFMASAPGKYFLDVTSICGDFYTDTINVTEEMVAFTPVTDQTKCNLETIRLNGPNGFSNYNWLQQGVGLVSTMQSPVLNPTVTSVYFLTAEKSVGCLIYDTALITVLNVPPINLGVDTGFCKDKSIIINAGSTAVSYFWSTGASSHSIEISTGGSYRVAAQYANGCVVRDTISITEYPVPFVSLGTDVTICKDIPRKLSTSTEFLSYLWQDGTTTKFYNTATPGSYSIKVVDKYGCAGTGYIDLILSNCAEGVFIPKAFTPNQDNLNDQIKPVVKGNLLSYRFLIFNRYGERVFESSDIRKGWDGNFKGAAQNNGAYIWVCEFQFAGKNKQVEKGDMLLIR